jgi:hypothetical protein
VRWPRRAGAGNATADRGCRCARRGAARWPGRALAAGLLAALLGGGGDAAAQAANEEAEPWSAVARVLRDGKGACSGVLVASRTVMTVGHCVARRKPWRALPTERVTVRFDGVDHAVAAIRLDERSPFRGDGRLGPVAHDWAVLELVDAPEREPVPYRGGGAVRRAFVLDEPVVKAGWRAGTVARDDTCRIADVDAAAHVFTFTCGAAAGRGRSGSALFVRRAGAYAVIGVQSAEAQSDAATVGIAISPDPAVLER